MGSLIIKLWLTEYNNFKSLETNYPWIKITSDFAWWSHFDFQTLPKWWTFPKPLFITIIKIIIVYLSNSILSWHFLRNKIAPEWWLFVTVIKITVIYFPNSIPNISFRWWTFLEPLFSTVIKITVVYLSNSILDWRFLRIK